MMPSPLRPAAVCRLAAVLWACGPWTAPAAELPATAAAAELPAAQPPASGVYERLYREFARHPHRRIGSPELDAVFQALDAELQGAGLVPRYQTFRSLVQQTDHCRLTLDGVPVEGVMMVDHAIAPWILDEPIEGPLQFIGPGTLEAFSGRDIAGSVVVVDAALPGARVPEAFMHGAQAVILVGDEGLDPWRAASLYGFTATLVPTLYMDRAEAERAGLTSADGSRVARIDAHSRLVDTEGRNLWVELPATEAWTGDLDVEEVVILSATLDTYGMTPERSPDLRRAANAALLAEVLVALAEQPRRRKVVAVFFGSSYAAVEGARYLYHAIDMADKAANSDDLTVRHERLQQELADADMLLAAAARDDVVAAADNDTRRVAQRFRRTLMAHVNRQRHPIGELNLERAALRAERDHPDRPPDAERLATLDARLAELDARLEREQSQRRRWNDLLGQLAMRRLNTEDPDSMRTFHAIRDEVVALIRLRREEVLEARRHNETSMALSALFENRAVVGHFDLDFARSDQPWMLSMINAYGLFRGAPIDTGSYLPHLTAMGAIHGDTAASLEGEAPLFRSALTPFYKPFSLSIPNQRQVPSVVGTALGIAGFQLMTVGDSLAHDGLPYAVHHDLEGLAPQLVAWCTGLANDPRLSLRRVFTRERMEERFTYLRGRSRDPRDIAGVSYQNYARESSDPEGVAHNAIAVFTGFSNSGPTLGQSMHPWARVETHGYIYLPMVSRIVATRAWRSRIFGFGYDERGRLDRVSRLESARGVSSAPIPLFYAHGGLGFSFGFAPDPLGGELYRSRTLIARNDAAHRNAAEVRFGWAGMEFFADRRDPIKRIGAHGELLLGATPDKPLGEGVPIVDNALLRLDGIAQGAHDYWLLNDLRLRVLRQRNIINDDLEALHADAREHLDAAREARSRRAWALARAHHIFATNIANRVYAPLRNVTEDLVRAVVVLLLLNVPFAFAMERLICGFTSIYRQVLGFVGFFLATFFILFMTHPAFSLASAPTIIFLAFVIILLATLTISIVMGKIKQEIRAMQGLASTVHGVESDNSTSMAAVLIGISGMRNRPLKTFLTSITVVLLTFTILVFASFTSRQGVVDTYLGRGQGEDRIELHRFSFLDIDKALVSGIETIHADDFHVFRRGGVFRNPTRGTETGVTPLTPERVLYLPRTARTAAVGALMGLDPGEFVLNPDLARTAPGLLEARTEHPPLFLPALLAEVLEAEVGDRVLMNGYSMTYAGPTHSGALQNLTTIDDFRVTPPDFAATIRNTGRTGAEGMGAATLEEMDIGSFEWFSPENVAIARIDDLETLFGDGNYVHFMTLYPRRSGHDIETTARDLAPVFHGAVHVQSSEGARRMFFTRAVEGSGFADVIVPLLLGGLIIFSSLMGSIVDREREIFTYSALGLAPPDVGALFFAESAVYSVIGGMGGYLVSQVVAKGLTTLGNLGVLTPPEMNFSSLTSVLTILIVMAVVMLSTIYPAIKAGRSANPGVARKWKMPAPEGDHLRFVFPFTVSELDFTGILSFIREHFENHNDATLGSFAAKEVRLFRVPGGKGSGDAIGIEANVSLAPFDLGIFQRFRMYSSEFEIKGIDEVVVELHRIGGTPASWIRSNRGFADELRKQFLLWRSLPIATIEHYRAATIQSLDGASGEPGTDPS